MKKYFSLLLMFMVLLCITAHNARAAGPVDNAKVPAQFAGYIEIMGDKYHFGATVGDLAKNGWVDKKTKNPKSFKYFADMGTVIPAGIYCNPLIEFSQGGYTIKVFAHGNLLKQDTPIGDLIIQRIEIVSDRVAKENNVPWVLDNGFSSKDTMKRMMALYPKGQLEDEDNRKWVDDHSATNSYLVSSLNGGLPKDGLWASIYMEHSNNMREVIIHYNAYEYVRSPQGMKLYATK